MLMSEDWPVEEMPEPTPTVMTVTPAAWSDGSTVSGAVPVL
jgi:hypothetical protein